MQKKEFFSIALMTGLLLMIPSVAMQFVDGMVWNLFDFFVAGILLFSTGVIFMLAVKKIPKHKIIIGVLIIFAFVWLWAELAVGIFTNWGS